VRATPAPCVRDQGVIASSVAGVFTQSRTC
jgi:hypothetical protein